LAFYPYIVPLEQGPNAPNTLSIRFIPRFGKSCIYNPTVQECDAREVLLKYFCPAQKNSIITRVRPDEASGLKNARNDPQSPKCRAQKKYKIGFSYIANIAYISH